MKLFFLSGMVIAGFAGSMTASNVILQEDESAGDATTITQTQSVADEGSAGTLFTKAATLAGQSDGRFPLAATQEVAGVTQDGFGTIVAGPRATLRTDKTSSALRALKKAKADDDDDAQAEAERSLRSALEDEYDAMLESHEKQLDALEKKISELRKQLRRREDAKSELVDLRFKMMLHEADGLGWPGRGRGASGFGMGVGGLYGEWPSGSLSFGPGGQGVGGASSGGGGGAVSPRASGGIGDGGGARSSAGRTRSGGGVGGTRDREDRRRGPRDSGGGSGGRLK